MSAMTTGVHHVGLTVSNIEDSAKFFTQVLAWDQVGENKDYPAIFVSDGTVMLTLWQQQSGEQKKPFDKNHNIGLHHLALRVADHDALQRVYQKIVETDNITIEFAPELLRDGPAMHMMCYEPGGARIEFIAV